MASRADTGSQLCRFCVTLTLESIKAAGTVRKVSSGFREKWVNNNDDGHAHHETFANLVQSAAQGCELCKVLVHGSQNHLERNHHGKLPAHLSASRCHITTVYSTRESQVQGILLRCGTTILGEYGVVLNNGEVDGLRGIIDGRMIVQDPLGCDGLAKIKSWLRMCMNEHPECARSGNTSLPTRVIDVRPARPRLQLTDGSSGQYVALSHCWGGVTSFRTTKNVIHERLGGFDIEELPQNFRDAIRVTRRLEIPYLWIDSLCIIQDDAVDWEQEAGRMIDVYRNSLLTISAMSANNSHEGFLHRRNSPGRTSCAVPFSSSEKQISGMVDVFWPPSTAGPDILATRGWTLQELILPSRVLHFSSEQMIWDCRAQQREDNLSPLITGNLGARIRAELKSNGVFQSSPYQRWYALVENYTSRAITVPGDKLTAIAGLAREIQISVDGDEYLAGLWKQDFIAGLMWTPSENRRLHRMEEAYRAPSWSWASCDGRVSYAATLHDRGQRFSLEIVNVVVEHSGPNALGMLKPGCYLKANAMVRRTQVTAKNIFGLYDFEDGRGEFLPDDDEDAQGKEIWCVNMLAQGYVGDSTTQMYPHGLALKRTEELDGHQFRRVGTFKLRPEREGADWFEGCERRMLIIY